MNGATDLEPLSPLRDAFDLPRDVVWMNCAQMSAAHREVREAGYRAIDRKMRPWESAPKTFFSELETARQLFARLLGLDATTGAEGVAIAPSASYGLTTAARNLPLARGQKVIVAEGQFPSNVYPWMRAAADAGADLEIVKRAPDGDVTQSILDAIDTRTAIVATAAVFWADGTAIDLARIAAAAKSVGAALALDLTQSLGAVPFDAAALDPDFVVCPAYKWLLGPYSTGFFWVAERWREGRPLEETWMNRRDADDFAGLVDYTPHYMPGARRYDMGEKSNFHLMPMTIRALELLLEWRPERIAAHLDALNGRLVAALADRGFQPPPDRLRSPHYFGVGLPDHAPADLAQRLAAEQVHVSIRGARMRISPHLWIDAEDEARFIAAVDRALAS